MALSIFEDKRRPPSDDEVAAALKRTAPLWRDLQRRVAALAPGVVPEWTFAGKTTGWGFRLSENGRVVIYMTPCDGHFLASVVLGEKSIARARAERLPGRVDAVVAAAPRYAEGRGVRLIVRNRADVATAISLVGVKLGI